MSEPVGGHVSVRGKPAVVAWGLCGLTGLLAATRLVLTIVDPGAADPSGFGGSVPMAAFELSAFTALAAIGALVASRQPRNAVGWFICAAPLLLAAGTLVERAYSSALEGGSPAQLALWLANWTWVPALVPVLTLVPLLFPTGRPPTPRWRWVMWLAAGGGVAVLIGFAFAPGPLENYPDVINPVGVGSGLKGVIDAITGLGFLLLACAVLASAAALIYRFRRSRGIERQQLKWVAAATAVSGVGWSLMATVGSFVDSPTGNFDVGWILLVLGMLVIAAAVGIAMLRYRLYDIDVVINRTLVYGALTATLAATYLGCVLVLQLALGGLTADSSLAIAASTLAVAALFRPARNRIQQLVDRRFYRLRYDAARTLESFGSRLRDEVALDSLSSELCIVVAETMQPAHVSLWLRGAEVRG
jgi:hypothetical protein